MREQDIQDLIIRQRPYYHLEGTPIRGLENQYWLVFKHQDADSLLKNVIRFLGFGNQDTTHKLIRIDERTGYIITYAPKNPGDIPSTALLRTGSLSLIKQFLKEVTRVKDKTLLANSFRGIENLKGHYNIPQDLEEYQAAINQLLQRSTIYRRATAYFDSGLLKVYEEPLQDIIQADGRIRLLMDWRGFTKERDILALEQLYDTSNPTQFIQRTLAEFLQGLAESNFSGTEILAELIRLGFLEIKLVKMEGGRGIYHSKTGIFSDSKDNHALHEGSNNFTVAAHSRNFERCLFLRSWVSESDRSSILEFIEEFDEEWSKPNFAYDLSSDFLQQVLQEKQRRTQIQQPQIDSINPDLLTPGLNTVEIVGEHLDRVTDINVTDNDLISILLQRHSVNEITSQTPDLIQADVTIDPDHPPQSIDRFIVQTTTGTYTIQPKQPPTVELALTIPDFPEIPGFKQAVETLLSGKHGQPQDFLYWLSQQRPHQFRIQQSDLLEQLTNERTLFEHQKSGAQHCLQVMENFGVAVCADAVGLGKTRLAAAVARLYLQNNPQAFKELGFPAEIVTWFENRDIGLKNFTEDTDIFRRTYKELFLQRTRQQLRDATPDLNTYARRQAAWLPVNFEEKTEQALDKIFTRFEQDLHIPFSDPVRYFTGSGEQRGLLQNQRRFFLQRAESSMYALGQTIINFRRRIEQMQDRLNNCTPDPEGLREFLFEHYKFSSTGSSKAAKSSDQLELWDREDEEEDEDELEAEPKLEKRQKLKTSIEQATDGLDTAAANRIHQLLLYYCDSDLAHLVEIQKLLTTEFIKDHKREQVTQKVRELTAQGHKVLLISTFSDTVIDYFSYMAKDRDIADAGIGLAIGSTKQYYSDDKETTFTPHHACKGDRCSSHLKRKELFRLFAPIATCKNPVDRPQADREIAVLIGSETLSIGQNLQDANYLINIDLPWNPMMLEQRIGRIDRPKHQPTENIYIYYANSESQLLRQASRLNNLNKKLVGDLAQPSEDIRELDSMSNLGASVYGDTRFDDTILPGYIEFIHSLVAARNLEQENFQEQASRKQDTAQDRYTHQELLYASDIQRLITRLGEDYQANPISIGHQTGTSEPSGLLALTRKYFGPNGEPIPDLQRQIFWNDLTSDREGFGNAIAMAVRTTEFHQTTSTQQTLACMTAIYQELINFKQSLVTDLKISNLDDRVNISSDRLNKINSL